MNIYFASYWLMELKGVKGSVSFRFHQDKGVKIVNTKITFITFANN